MFVDELSEFRQQSPPFHRSKFAQGPLPWSPNAARQLPRPIDIFRISRAICGDSVPSDGSMTGMLRPSEAAECRLLMKCWYRIAIHEILVKTVCH